ncbi:MULTISPECIES: DUF6233 domain-containing protein [Streptomyces]|uniref:DUF6233 domain-containing protein n=1 Tax=Streptomyces eurythermus TaxID=42237 RepID=A0ABW6YZN7_9ACTN
MGDGPGGRVGGEPGPVGPVPGRIEGTPHRIRADEARAALTDPTVTPCSFCRPDTDLGIDLA